MAGNYIMSVASQLLASIDDCYVTSVISGIVHDLVAGEVTSMADNFLRT